jgi:hypothetical protein
MISNPWPDATIPSSFPASGLRNFQELLEEMLAAANEIPKKSYPPQPQDADGNC